MLAKFLFNAILSLLLVSTRIAAFDTTVGKVSCKSLAFSLTLTASEVAAGSDVTLQLYRDGNLRELLDTMKIDIDDHFSSTDLTYSGEFTFAKKFTKSNPTAVLVVTVVDSDGDYLVFDGEIDSYFYQTPIKCENAAAIAGGVVGGIVGLALIGALVFVVRRKRQRKTASDGVVENATTSTQPALPFSPYFGVQSTGSPDEKSLGSPMAAHTSFVQQPHAAGYVGQQHMPTQQFMPQRSPSVVAAPQQFSPIFQQPTIYRSQ